MDELNAEEVLNGFEKGMLDFSDERCWSAIKSALHKQIAKTPYVRHSVKFGDRYNDGYCPCCGHTVEQTYLDVLKGYCSECGQLLDWSAYYDREENL